MHGMVLFRTFVVDEGEPEEELREFAISNVDEAFEPYVGSYMDYYNVDDKEAKSFLVTKSGEEVQACRATDLAGFKDNCYPYAFLWDGIRDCFMFHRYGFPWENVIKKEIEDAQKDVDQWFVAVDIHI